MNKPLKILISLLLFSLITVLLVTWNSIEDCLILSKRFERPETRTECWHQDLNYLKNYYLKVDRSFSAQASERFKAEIELIENSIHLLSDNQILVRIMHAVALANNAHSSVKYRFLPKIGLCAFWFKEGLYITKTADSKKHHLGKRITKINDLTVDQVVEKFDDYIPGNKYNKRYSVPNLIIRPDFWNGINTQYSSEKMVVEMIDSTGRMETDTFEIEPINSTLINLYWHNRPDSIFVRHEKPFDCLPLYLCSPYKSAMYKKLNEESIYIQINSSTNKGLMLNDFSEDLKSQFDSVRFKDIVLDLRLNSGGNYLLSREIENQIKLEVTANSGHLFLIIGNQTASAAICMAASLKSQLSNNITIVGEPIGDSLVFWAEPKNFKLPNSKIEISASTYQHDLRDGSFIPFKTYWGNLFCDFASNGLDVDIPIEVSINNYITYEDPVMAAITKLMENNKTTGERSTIH